MLVSVAWLRELCPFAPGPQQVAAALTARGLTVDALREEEGDVLLEVDVPANRPDCLGHRGIARELSAAFGVPLVGASATLGPSHEEIESRARVQIDAPELCGRYTARLVRGVRVGPSPAALAARLRRCGLHAINNVVDVSNLVLLETGHPIHTFDFEKIAERTIRVRCARAGETLTTLDGVARALDPSLLVIADASRPVALAGIMGGASSEIRDTTTEVLIEAAWFSPRSIRSSARRLGMATDASYRFERGADPEGVVAAQELALRLLQEVCGGTPVRGTLDVHPGLAEPRTLELRQARVRLLLGYDPGADAIASALRALGLAPVATGAGSVRVTVPSFRVDLEREADVVEEVARHLGYDQIPAHFPATSGAPPAPDPHHVLEERCRDVLAHAGFQEAFCYSMVGAAEDDPFVGNEDAASPALVLTNPIAEPMTFLRRSLLPGLLRAADFNLRRGARDVRLFEVGRVFLRSSGALPREPLRVALAWCGAARPRHFSAPPPDVDLGAAAGMVEALLTALRPGTMLARGPIARAGLHPGRSVAWSDSGEPANGSPALAWCGAVHPELRSALDLAAEIFVAEIDLDRLCASPAAPLAYAPIPKVPSVTRDLSILLAEHVLYADVHAALRRIDAPAKASFELVDRYVGPPLGPGEVSCTVRVILQPLDRTLTDGEVETYRTLLVGALEQDLGARLRDH